MASDVHEKRESVRRGSAPEKTPAICVHDDDEAEPTPVGCKPIVSINGEDLKDEDGQEKAA